MLAIGRVARLQRMHGSRARAAEEVVVRLVGCLGRVGNARTLVREGVLRDDATVSRRFGDSEPNAGVGELDVIVVVVGPGEGGIERGLSGGYGRIRDRRRRCQRTPFVGLRCLGILSLLGLLRQPCCIARVAVGWPPCVRRLHCAERADRGLRIPPVAELELTSSLDSGESLGQVSGALVAIVGWLRKVGWG